MQCNTMRYRGEPKPSSLRIAMLLDSPDVRQALYNERMPEWYYEDEEEKLIERNTYQAMIDQLIY